LPGKLPWTDCCFRHLWWYIDRLLLSWKPDSNTATSTATSRPYGKS